MASEDEVEGMAVEDETVCSFCGMSHLMYSEQRKSTKEIGKRGRRIYQLEGHIEHLGLVVPPPAEGDDEDGWSAPDAAPPSKPAAAAAPIGRSGGSRPSSSSSKPVAPAATRAHYEQLQSMQESCNAKLATVNRLEADLAAAQKATAEARAATAAAEAALDEERQVRELERRAAVSAASGGQARAQSQASALAAAEDRVADLEAQRCADERSIRALKVELEERARAEEAARVARAAGRP